MSLVKLRTLAAILVAGFVVSPSTSLVFSQESPPPQVNLSDPQLRSFARAYVAVEKIRQEYEPRLKEAKDPQQGKEIQAEAVSRMHGELSKEGFTEDTYNQIFDVARADAELRKTLINLINEERKKS
jgi:Domain of unknown function (DUF4168)